MTNSTDILIPLGKGSRHDNLELRYCLRSIEKYLKNVGTIVIVGEKPEWLQTFKEGIIHISEPDSSNNWQRAHNIYKKIRKGINATDLSDNFLFMNDDHNLLSDYEASEFPYYTRGEITLESFVNNQPQYKQMKNTLQRITNTLKIIGCGLDYDIHCPILYNKNRFIKIFENLLWPEYGYGIKSMYCNLDEREYGSKVIPDLYEDLKFHEPLMKETIYKVLEDRLWFSIGDRCLKSGDMKEVLQELYPNKSKYEL